MVWCFFLLLNVVESTALYIYECKDVMELGSGFYTISSYANVLLPDCSFKSVIILDRKLPELGKEGIRDPLKLYYGRNSQNSHLK